MKRLVKITFAMALSSMLFFSCSKDEIITKSPEKVKITLSANKDGIASKTAAIEGETSFSYIWTDEDVTNMKLYTVSGGNVTEVTNKTVTKVSDKNLTITTEVESGKTYTFRAILSNPDHSSVQQPNGTTSFDPEADVYVSDDLNVTVAENGNTTADLNLKFNHKVVGNKMTLKNMTAGEKVSKVVISSDKFLAGHLSNGSMVGDGKEITINYNNLVVPEGGQFPVFFTSMANSGQTLTVKVTTDKHIYTKTFAKTIDLVLGQFTRFGVALTEGEKIATILFGTSGTQINGANVAGDDNQGNEWKVKLNGYSNYVDLVQTDKYSQIGDNNEYVSSITFTTTLPLSNIKSMSISLRTTNESAYGQVNKVELYVGANKIGTGYVPGSYSLDPVTISVEPENVSGTDLKITVSNLVGGIQVYGITVVYE